MKEKSRDIILCVVDVKKRGKKHMIKTQTVKFLKAFKFISFLDIDFKRGLIYVANMILHTE